MTQKARFCQYKEREPHFSNMYSFLFHTHLRATRGLDFKAEIKFKSSLVEGELTDNHQENSRYMFWKHSDRLPKSGCWFIGSLFNIKNRLLSHKETYTYLKVLKPYLRGSRLLPYSASCVQSLLLGAGEEQFHPSKCIAVGPGAMQAAVLNRTDLPTTGQPRHLDLDSQPFKWPIRSLLASRNNCQVFQALPNYLKAPSLQVFQGRESKASYSTANWLSSNTFPTYRFQLSNIHFLPISILKKHQCCSKHYELLVTKISANM